MESKKTTAKKKYDTEKRLEYNYRRMLSKQDVHFDDFEGDAKDGIIMGTIDVAPRFINFLLLCRYECKVSQLLCNAGFSLRRIDWEINTDSEKIGFCAIANEIE